MNIFHESLEALVELVQLEEEQECMVEALVLA
jgi:hypothetical protein